MKNLLIRLTALFFSIAPMASFADYSIYPLKLNIRGEQKITSMKFRTNESEAKTFQLSVYEVTGTAGNEKFKPTKDILATPKVFRTKAGVNEQTVRVSVKNKSKSVNKRYRLSVKEINPKVLAANGSALHIVPDFQVPLTVER